MKTHCKIKSCVRLPHASQMCRHHYRQMYNFGEIRQVILPPIKKRGPYKGRKGTCASEYCKERSESIGFNKAVEWLRKRQLNNKCMSPCCTNIAEELLKGVV